MLFFVNFVLCCIFYLHSVASDKVSSSARKLVLLIIIKNFFANAQFCSFLWIDCNKLNLKIHVRPPRDTAALRLN